MKKLILIVALAGCVCLSTTASAVRHLWDGWHGASWLAEGAGTTSTSTSTTSTSSTSTTSTSTSSTTTTSTSSTTTTTLAGVAPTNWGTSFIAWWDEEEANNATAVANATTTCGNAGTDCNLADHNSVARDTTNFVIGAKSANFVAASNNYQDCADATCDELDCTGTNDLTVGAWIRPVSHATTMVFMKNNGVNTGFAINTNTFMNFVCAIGDGTDSVTATSAVGATPDNTWTHAVCRFTDSTDTIQDFINGATSGSSATQQSCAADTSPFELSRNSAAIDFDGQVDEAFVATKALSAAQVCRVCACGIDGTYCLCDGSNNANYKACVSDAQCTGSSAHGKCDLTTSTCKGRNDSTNPGCGGCTNAACNAAAP